jgi:hypothetical protein
MFTYIHNASRELVEKYAIMFISIIYETDKDGKPINIDKVNYGFVRFKPDKYGKVLNALLTENKYDIKLFNLREEFKA